MSPRHIACDGRSSVQKHSPDCRAPIRLGEAGARIHSRSAPNLCSCTCSSLPSLKTQPPPEGVIPGNPRRATGSSAAGGHPVEWLCPRRLCFLPVTQWWGLRVSRAPPAPSSWPPQQPSRARTGHSHGPGLQALPYRGQLSDQPLDCLARLS